MSKAARAAWGTALIAQRKGVLVVFGPPEDPLTREAMAACFALGPAVLSDKKAPHTAIACGGGEPNPVADKAGVERVVSELIKSPRA